MSTVRVDNIENIEGSVDIDVRDIQVSYDALVNKGEYREGIILKKYQDAFTKEGVWYVSNRRELPFSLTGDWGIDKEKVRIHSTLSHEGLLNRNSPNAHDASAISFSGGGYSNVQEALSSASKVTEKTQSIAPFGLGGIKPVLGLIGDAHYGWGGIVVTESGKWVYIYRKGPKHGTSNNVELRAVDSYDKGISFVNDRLILSSSHHDLRPDPPKAMANGRIGFLVNRASESGGGHFSPLFVYSDDSGESFLNKEITTSSPYTFQSNGGMIEFPLSQGGDDAEGFIAFGFLSSGGYDALHTKDNGDSWQMTMNVAMPFGPVAGLSEWSGCRVGEEDKWVFFLRSRSGAGWNENMYMFKTENLFDWGLPINTGLELWGNPPSCIYDSGDVHILNCSRGDRDIDGVPNALMHVSIDARFLFSSSGDMASLGYKYKPYARLPQWFTGYLANFRDPESGGWYTTAIAGEDGVSGGDRSITIMIGDFSPTVCDFTNLLNYFIARQREVRSIELVSDTNSVTQKTLNLYNASRTASVGLGPYSSDFNSGGHKYTITFSGLASFKGQFLFGGLSDRVDGKNATIAADVRGADFPAIRTSVAGGASREHLIFHNANGVVGSIATAGNETSFLTTSDESLKEIMGEYSVEDALRIIKNDPVLDYKWRSNGDHGVGWSAQRSHSVDNSLAKKGGWFLDDIEVDEGTEGATYVPWSMDYSRRVPLLWAAVSYLLDELNRIKSNR